MIHIACTAPSNFLMFEYIDYAAAIAGIGAVIILLSCLNRFNLPRSVETNVCSEIGFIK